MTMTRLPGDPDSLGHHAARYVRVAETIATLSARLDVFAAEMDGSSGLAATALAERAEEAATHVARAQPRYATTAQALSRYSVQLRDAQISADRAIDAESTASAAMPYLLERRRELRTYHPRMPISDAEREDRELELRQVEARLEVVEADVASARAAYDRAVAFRDASAESAVAAIRPVLETLNDTVGDHVDAWVDSLPDFAQAIAQWIGDVLVAVIETLDDLVEAFLAAVTYLVVYISVFAEILANYPPELWLAMLISPVLGVTIVLALTSYLAARLAKEPFRPTPPLVVAGQAAGSSRDGHRYADTMTANMVLDDNGGTDNTQIQVVEVLDENGERVGWRVILPSTQDWQEVSGFFGGTGPEGDQGALNDFDSNLALMLTPSQQAAYERAVIEAMLHAGVGPDDPVMLTGWSQGGIMAGVLASDPDLPFNIRAVYVSGSPIDAMAIPSTVTVISVQHPGDVVHQVDGPLSAPARQSENWVTVTPPVPKDPATRKPYSQSHNAEAYIASAGTAVDSSTDQRVQQIVAQQSQFFSDNELVTIYSTAEEPVPL